MTAPFKPPSGVAALARVDVAGVEYGDACQVIEGIVSPRGGSAWQGKDGSHDVHCFSLAAWRCVGGAVVTKELTLLRPVPPDRPGQPRGVDIFAALPAYSIQWLRVLFSRDRTRAVVEMVLPHDAPDRELAALAEEMMKEVRIPTEGFGELVLNPRLGWFEGRREWAGSGVQVTFEPDADGSIADALRTAQRLWADQAGWQFRVEEFAVAQLLTFKNEEWPDEEGELSAEQFVAEMRLTSIGFSEEGSFTFWFDDGALFGGHGIEIRGDIDSGLTEADNHI